MKNINQSNQDSLSWDRVEKYLREKTFSGNAMALVETEKLFREVIKKLDFPGKDIDKQIKVLRSFFSDYRRLKRAREQEKKILKKINYEISSEDAQKYLSAYYQAINDLIEFKKKKISFWKKMKFYLRLYIPCSKNFSKKFILTLFIFFLIIFILDSTNFGAVVVDLFVKISHLIFSWVLFVALLIAGIAILVIGTIYYFESRKKK